MNISIAMTTYKSKAYVKEQLESIFNQTLLPDEIIICDDASPDDTVDYLREIIKNAPSKIQIKIFKNEINLGFQLNFEQCMKKCQGDVIFLCDADDVWYPEKIERVTSEFEKDNSVVMCYHDAVIIDGEGHMLKESLNAGWDLRSDKTDSKALLEMEIKRKGCPNGMVMTIRKELLNFAMPFRTEVSHDEWLIMCAPLLGKVVCMEERLASYRRHSSNTSGTKLTLKERMKRVDRGGWFLHPDRIVNVFISFKDRYWDLLEDSTKKLLDTRIKFDTEMVKIASSKKFGVLTLIKFWFSGTYQEFRGNRNTFITDEAYLMYRLGDYVKEKKKK